MSTQLLVPASPRMVRFLPNPRFHAQDLHRQKGIWASGLTKTAAESFLDWLEVHGHRDCQVSYVVGEGFAVTVNDPEGG
jgi:hypothetical protein